MRTFVTPQQHADLIIRDKGCVLRDMPGHVCRDIFGDAHGPFEVEKLSVEHVKRHSTLGRRAPSKMPFMVLLDRWTNNKPPSKEEREVMRAHLRALYPATWGDA